MNIISILLISFANKVVWSGVFCAFPVKVNRESSIYQDIDWSIVGDRGDKPTC